MSDLKCCSCEGTRRETEAEILKRISDEAENPPEMAAGCFYL